MNFYLRVFNADGDTVYATPEPLRPMNSHGETDGMPNRFNPVVFYPTQRIQVAGMQIIDSNGVTHRRLMSPERFTLGPNDRLRLRYLYRTDQIRAQRGGSADVFDPTLA